MRPRIGIALVLSAGLFALASCRSNDNTQNPGGGTGAEGQPQVVITSPVQGQEITSPLKLVAVVNGAEIGPTDTGRMHLHVYFGGSSEYEVVESLSTDMEVPPGTKEIRVVLADANHNETNVADTVRVSTTGSGEAPAEQPTGADDGGYDRGY